MEKILVLTNPVAPFQKVCVVKDDNLVEQVGITPNYIPEVVCQMSQKYDVTKVVVYGTEDFARGILDLLQVDYLNYTTTTLDFEYAGGIN